MRMGILIAPTLHVLESALAKILQYQYQNILYTGQDLAQICPLNLSGIFTIVYFVGKEQKLREMSVNYEKGRLLSCLYPPGEYTKYTIQWGLSRIIMKLLTEGSLNKSQFLSMEAYDE